MPSQLKILFVDDHEGLRDGIGVLISQKNPLLSFVYASNKKAALESCKKNSEIEIAIVDINLDGEDGLELIGELRNIKPTLKFLVYSMYSDALHIERALKSNIQGYVTKDAKMEELEKAIVTICEGGMYYNKRASQLMHTMLFKDTAIVDDEFSASVALIENYKTLTKKEQECFMLFAQGNSAAEVAAILKKAEKTVVNQRSMIYSKLNLKDRLDLQNAARVLGIIV